MVCNKPQDIINMEKALEDMEKMPYWDEIESEIRNTCLKIAQCDKKCGNDFCYGLQHSDEIQMAFAEEVADNSIYDTLPDDEIF